MTKIFFDTEFTGLHQNTSLISIGLITDENRYFYAEIIDYDKSQVDDWVKENVIKKLKYKGEKRFISKMFKKLKNDDEICAYEFDIKMSNTKKEVSKMLMKWLSSFDDISFISDVSHYDMVLLIDLLKENNNSNNNEIPPFCHDINQDIAEYFKISEMEAFDKSREKIIDKFLDKNLDYFLKNVDKHNSLYDAYVIKKIYENIK